MTNSLTYKGLALRPVRFVCLECDIYVEAEPGARAVRCPTGHSVNPIAGTSFKKQVVKFAVLAAGIPLAGIIVFSRVVVFSPWFGWSIIAVLTVLMPLIFVVLSTISVARWSKQRQATDLLEHRNMPREVSTGQGNRGVGWYALIVLTVFIPFF